MDKIDRRIIYLELETPSGLRRYDGMSVEYSITKTGGTRLNEAEIKISNLSRDVRNFIVTATSPLSSPRREKSVRIYAGYESTGVTRRFVGDVISATLSQPPDIWLTMTARTGAFSQGNILARNAPYHTNLSVLARSVAEDLGLTLDFQAEDKGIGNYSFTGSALKQVNKLADAGLVDAYVDDDRLIVKDRGAPLKGNRRKLSKKTGMIGMPHVNEKGATVTMLFDPYTAIGTELEIESTINPAANGLYTVCGLRENCALRSSQFYLEAEAVRHGLGGNVV